MGPAFATAESRDLPSPDLTDTQGARPSGRCPSGITWAVSLGQQGGRPRTVHHNTPRTISVRYRSRVAFTFIFFFFNFYGTGKLFIILWFLAMNSAYVFFFTSLLEYDCFTMVCYLLLYNSKAALRIHRSPYHLPLVSHISLKWF